MDHSQESKSSSLATMVKLAHAVEASIVENSGELTPELEAAITSLDLTLPIKIDSYCHVLDRLDLIAEKWRQDAKKYTDVARALEKAHDRIKERVKFIMNESGITKLKGDKSQFTLANGIQSLRFIETKMIPNEYMIITTTTSPDKDRIRDELKAGKKLEFAYLEETKRLIPGLRSKE